MTDYNIAVCHCNSIEEAHVAISKECLNIKYGPNGLGKSTIARAIIGKAKEDGSLERLMPFKHIEVYGAPEPTVEGLDDIKTVMLFDDDYVDQFVFQHDEVVKNSFEVFVKNSEFTEAMSDIEELFSGIKQAFKDNEDIGSTIADLKKLRDAFGVTKSGALSKASKGYKAVGSGNNIENIPEEFKPFEDYLKSDVPAEWITWQKKGNKFSELSENCPYCSSNLTIDNKIEKARNVEKEYDSKSVEHLSALQIVIEKLGAYFTKECNDGLLKITTGTTELAPEQEAFLRGLSLEVTALIDKLEGLNEISFFKLRDIDVDELEARLGNFKIDLDMIPKVNSKDTKTVVDPINEKLSSLVSRVGDLKGKINKQKAQIKKTIEKNQSQINDFLKSAGYRYSVQIIAEQESYKMKLVHQDHSAHIEKAERHLSYGEKNAFALILFMYQALREEPDLVVLDDPISSFDKNKKFAIIHKLFKGKQSFRGMTVLMLTHDIEPAIDMIRVRGVGDKFQALKPSATFLSSKMGVINEIPILREDIQTFSSVCRDNIERLDNDVVRAIYLRRHYEILDDHGDEYNLLASLLHGKEKPEFRKDGTMEEMASVDIEKAEANISEHIEGFSYGSVLNQVCNVDEIKQNFNDTEYGYEKIQLFRIISELVPEYDVNDVIAKFINETFHIENEFVMQLNPQKFDGVPEYVVKECERVLNI